MPAKIVKMNRRSLPYLVAESTTNPVSYTHLALPTTPYV